MGARRLKQRKTKRLVQTLSLELRTADTCGGIRTTWCGISLLNGNHTRAGKLRFNVVNSAISLVVFASFVGIELNNLPMAINERINSNSGNKRGAYKTNFEKKFQ